MQGSMDAQQQNIFAKFYKNNPSLFIFTKFSVEKNKCWEIFKILRKLLFYF